MDKGSKKSRTQGTLFVLSASVVAAIAATGICLQYAAGPFDIKLLAYPANVFAAVALVLAAGMAALARGSAFFRWVSGVPLSAALICGLAVTGIIMGLVPQQSHVEIKSTPLPTGLHGITSSWPFVLLYVAVMFVLMCTVIRRAFKFRLRDYAFYLNHLGLLLLLSAAGFGAADKDKFIMYAQRGVLQDGAYFQTREFVQLPFSVTLNSFDIEYYPPMVLVARWEPGEREYSGEPLLADASALDTPVRVGNRQVTVRQYIHNAVEGPNGFAEIDMPGAMPAALVEVLDTATGEVYEGWVSAGNAARYGSVLSAGGDYAAVMTTPEARRYVSEITVNGRGGALKKAGLEVNKPLRFGHWTLYQYGYDTEAGRMSQYSILQIVYDPWLRMAYAGIILLAAGCVGMVWRGKATIRKEARR